MAYEDTFDRCDFLTVLDQTSRLWDVVVFSSRRNAPNRSRSTSVRRFTGCATRCTGRYRIRWKGVQVALQVALKACGHFEGVP